MHLDQLVISGFQSFGPEPTTVTFEPRTFLIGPNGAGKTAVLHALARMFGFTPELRRIRESDFHRPVAHARGSSSEAGADEPIVVDGSATLTIEARFTYAELADDEELHPNVAPGFRHMSLLDADGVPELRVRLTAAIDADGEIEEQICYVTALDDAGEVKALSQMQRSDRSLFQVHYLPARRDPAEHIRHTANSLIGRVLRAASWSVQRPDIAALSDQITAVLAGNAAVSGLDAQLGEQWRAVHRGNYFTNPTVSFDAADLDGLLRHLTVDFQPAPTTPSASFERLSDGQQSLLYISLVLAVQALGRKAVEGLLPGFDLAKLRPPVFVLIAVEEPENSLSPQHLGRVLTQLTEFSAQEDAQLVLATHSPALLRRVHPKQIRHLRLNTARCTQVTTIELPKGDVEAAKFLREAVQAYPELYFSRLVVLGEGDSEEIILPRLFAARALVPDHVSVSVAPLGGRHVNHFWRLLDDLQIPYVTLLDLDAGRYGGGWGRVRYALNQYRLRRGAPGDFAEKALAKLASPDDDVRPDDDKFGQGVLEQLEEVGVFFSSPLDLDYAMLTAYEAAYEVDDDEKEEPDESTVVAVLGRQHGDVDFLYGDDEQSLFDAYRTRFKSSSKPAQHLNALARLSDKQLLKHLPPVYERLVAFVNARLDTLPE